MSLRTPETTIVFVNALGRILASAHVPAGFVEGESAEVKTTVRESGRVNGYVCTDAHGRILRGRMSEDDSDLDSCFAFNGIEVSRGQVIRIGFKAMPGGFHNHAKT